MEFTKENSLKALLQDAKKNEQLAPFVRSIQVVNHSEVLNIVEKCSESTAYLRDLFVKHLKTSEIKDKNTSTFTIASPDKINYTIVVKQKTISLMEIDLFQHVFPHLKSVYLFMFNLRYDEIDGLTTNKVANTISSIDMTFNTTPADISKLIMYVFDSYGENLEALKIKRGGGVMNKDTKWEEPSDEIANYGTKLLEHKYCLPNLETVEISQFYQYFPMAEFVECLSQSNCVLKHVSFIGVAKADSIASHLKNVASKSLKSLALDIYEYPNLQDLQDFPLEFLSLRWGDSTTIDIISVIGTFPRLKRLDLGYDVDYVNLDESKGQLNQAAVLESLTLHHAIIDKNVLEKLAHFLPKLNDLKLSNCKFGASRTSIEEVISLENYHLQQLILENCSLYSNKRDSVEKRIINKLYIVINSKTSYSAEITSKNRARMAKFENISNIDNTFSYYCFNENMPRPTNTLKILLKSIKYVKFDSMGFKALTFTSDCAAYSDLYESFTKVDIPNDGLIVNIKKETSFKETHDKNVNERKEDGGKVNHDDDEKEDVEKEESNENNDENDEDGEEGKEKDEDKDEEEKGEEEEEEEEEEKKHDSENELSVAETNRIEKLQEADQDYTSSEDTDSSSSDSEEEEEELSRRRSLRVRNVPININKRDLRKRKKVRYNSDVPSEEFSEDSSSNENDTDEVSNRDANRMRAFIRNAKLYKPIIRLYPYKSAPGYYN
ncbi:hypothetical protein BD408DRAFT_415423 [Parasitella parasitica]|nr:hypothetical protein BD408DRAFT_415423 [Parasitella parasitica]